jgi:hypothetical protein
MYRADIEEVALHAVNDKSAAIHNPETNRALPFIHSRYQASTTASHPLLSSCFLD